MGKSGFIAGNTGNGYFRYDFSYSLNGFTGTNATISISNNSLTITPTAGDASIAKTVSFPGSTFYFIRTRIKRTGGSGWDGNIYYSTSGHGSSASYRKQQIEPSWDGTFKDIYSDMSSLTAGGTDWIDNRITALRFDYGSTTDDTFEIKFIEIYANNWPTGVDLDDLYIRKSYFTQGNLWAWGQNNAGQLGVEDRTNRSSPVQTVAGGTNWKQVSMGNIHSAGIKTDGTLWIWGANNTGQLGTNDRTSRSSPVQTISGGNDWKQISLGGGVGTVVEHTASIKTDGTLWLWGYNFNGQLGTNDRTNRSSPVQTVSGGNDWKQVSAGGYHTSAIKTDGTLWIWGRNNEGQLGTNDIVHRSSPVQTVSGGNDWKQISIGERHSAAIKTDGTLWMWGLNSLGQLGTNDTTNHSSPVQTVSGGNDWKQVSAGRSHTAAVKIDGTLWVWGSNSGGQLGTNDTTNHSSPVQTISGGNDWKQVFSGMSTDSTSGHIIAIKNDGTLWAWGRNTEGQLGINDITSRSSPVQTLSGVSTWKNISAGANSSSAIRES